MKKSNTTKNSAYFGNSFLFLLALLSILMIVASALPQLAPSTLFSAAFALQLGDYPNGQTISEMDNNNNQVGEDDYNGGGLIGNLISQQQSPHADARNVNVDDKVIIVEDCDDSEIVINDNDQI